MQNEKATTHCYDPQGQEVWVWKKTTFDAAHQLPLYDGACKRVHGHTYFVELGVLCTINSETGMGIDLKEVGEFLRTNVVALFDHQFINERLPSGVQTTAEQIGLYILRVAARYFPAAVKVRVYETPDSWVELENDGSDNDMQVGASRDSISRRPVEATEGLPKATQVHEELARTSISPEFLDKLADAGAKAFGRGGTGDPIPHTGRPNNSTGNVDWEPNCKG